MYGTSFSHFFQLYRHFLCVHRHILLSSENFRLKSFFLHTYLHFDKSTIMPSENKKRVAEDEVSTNSSTKKSNTSTLSIVPSKIIGSEDEGYLEKLKNVWANNQDYSDANISLGSQPFQYAECTPFLENHEFLDSFIEKFDTFEFHEKASDLFQFRQSDDLKSFVDPHIYKIMDYLSNDVLTWLKRITGLPLNGNIDLFLSDYRKHDFLLCHDDELDSRRIAFILYLSKSWKVEFGGNLELFSATKDIHPNEVVKSITPEFNKFTFFSVGATSFHQVSEVTEEGVKRLALSGWFYGDPVQRPKIEFPKDEGYLLKDYLVSCSDIINQSITEGYLDEATIQDINEQVAEESQVLIPCFLKESLYQSICRSIVEQDVTFEKFVEVGPPNVSHYQEMLKGPPTMNDEQKSSSSSSIINVEGLQQLFHSNEFLQLMEKMTELPFSSSLNLLKVTTSLRKYSKGSYSLLRSGGAKQTGDGEDNKAVVVAEKVREETKKDDDEEDPNLVDIMYFVASKWNESWGGLHIFCEDQDGEQLITILPEGNCLAVVVRNSSVNSYVNYINSDSGEEVYFVYTMTCALDGNLS